VCTLFGKNLLILTEKTVEVERKKMSIVTESVNTSRNKRSCVYGPLIQFVRCEAKKAQKFTKRFFEM